MVNSQYRCEHDDQTDRDVYCLFSWPSVNCNSALMSNKRQHQL